MLREPGEEAAAAVLMKPDRKRVEEESAVEEGQWEDVGKWSLYDLDLRIMNLLGVEGRGEKQRKSKSRLKMAPRASSG